MTQRLSPEAPLHYSTVRLVSETDKHHMQVAQLLVPGVKVMVYSNENHDDVVWGAQHYVEAANPSGSGSPEGQRLLKRAIQSIEAGSYAVRVMVEISADKLRGDDSPLTAAFDDQVHQLQILAN